MRPLLLSLAVFLFAPSSPAQARDGSSIDEGTSYRLVIWPWHMALLRDRSELVAACRTRNTISACTDLIGRGLECTCQGADADWRIAASAHFIPFVYAWDVRKISHEREHVEDLRGAVLLYLQRLTSARFTSRESCEEAARRSEGAFEAEMNAMQRDSNAQLH